MTALTEKYVAGSGAGLTWTNGFTGSVLNSLAAEKSILSDLVIDNDIALDMWADVSIHLASASFNKPNSVLVFIYPLDDDGSTYGDGRFGSATLGFPPANYWAASSGIVAATQAQNITCRGILLPPGKFKWGMLNRGNTDLASSGNTFKYRSYNLAVA